MHSAVSSGCSRAGQQGPIFCALVGIALATKTLNNHANIIVVYKLRHQARNSENYILIIFATCAKVDSVHCKCQSVCCIVL